ncbi:sce7726 family protein [Kaistella palustris]|uniref:sce7726 family protein n=1 Tax=Kaistella palustris TaxID=493376 RepID=UPI000419330E|nr:sce7726 family protein [Kaistella palustris]
MDYSVLARSYKTLSYEKELREMYCTFHNNPDYNALSKHELTLLINEDIFKNYNGEQVLKYKIAKEFINKQYVAAFEVKVKSSRTDFLVINGDTKSFEIKSKIDTLQRLAKQTADYGTVFEYNTVLIDKCHLSKVIKSLPDFYGIWYYEGDEKIIFREASYSPNINSGEQLTLFNKKELKTAFSTSCIETILSTNTGESINCALKIMLKKRYNDRWNFLQNNFKKIVPIDLQFFFNTNVDPFLIYNIN